MIVSFQSFRLKVYPSPQGDGYIRPATGAARVQTLGADDVLVPNSTSYAPVMCNPNPHILLIEDFDDVYRRFRTRIIVNQVLAGVAWFVVVLCTMSLTLQFMYGELSWLSYLWLSVFGAVAMLLTPQAIRPVVHDNEGHWVNLRTGYTNLNGGEQLQV